MGIQRALSCWVVQDLKDGGELGAPFVVGVGGEERWAVKLARREEVSSVFDFSKVWRRITEGPPDMIFLCWVSSRLGGKCRRRTRWIV